MLIFEAEENAADYLSFIMLIVDIQAGQERSNPIQKLE